MYSRLATDGTVGDDGIETRSTPFVDFDEPSTGGELDHLA